MEDTKALKTNLCNLIAGGVAGALSRTIVSPLERLKILFQIQQNQRYNNGIWKTLVQMKQEEGWRKGFFKGNGTNVIRIAPYSAVQFATFEIYKSALLVLRNADPKTDSLVTWERLVSGSLAGISSVLATYPLDLIRTRLSLPDHNYKGILDCGKTLVSTEGGFVALFRGLGATVLGVAPYVGLNFAFYETFKEMFLPQTLSSKHLLTSSDSKSTIIKFACGGAAGALSQTITYPLDVLRRKMQVVGIDTRDTQGRVPNMRQVIKQMWQAEGISAFYRGIIPNYLKVIPAMSVSFVSYEWTKSFMHSIL